MKLYIKVITGFRSDQFHTLPLDEAHKAYYLFLNPEERGVFSNGVALVGKNIQSIVPDYHATMGWNSTHLLNSDDMNEIRNNGVETTIWNYLEAAKSFATNGERLNEPLTSIASSKQLPTGGLKSIKEIIS